MIDPKAVEAYLNRPLNNYAWLKKETVEALDKAIAELKPQPNFNNLKLLTAQKVTFILMEYLKQLGIFLDMGIGKTVLNLFLIRLRKARGETPKALVVVPHRTTVEAWEEEIKKHTPELKHILLNKSGVENLRLLEHGKAEIFICTFAGLGNLINTVVRNRARTKRRRNTKKWEFTPNQARAIFRGFDMLIIDEIHKMGGHGSIYYRTLRALRKSMEYVFGLTGTPFGRDLEDLWSQMDIIDDGAALGKTLGMFRAAFFTEKQGYFGGYQYKFRKSMMKKLKGILQHSTVRYRIEECTDMPKKKYITKKIYAPSGIVEYYNATVESLKKILSGKGKKDNLKELGLAFAGMQQLTSGFMTFIDSETKEKTFVDFEENPKLEALLEILEGTDPETKVIVFHNYRHTNEMISKVLTKKKIGHARAYGGVSNSIEQIRRFKTDPKCKVLLMNSASGASGNLQMADIMVFFEQPITANDRDQNERRIWRQGRVKPVLYIDLIMEGTHDIKQKIFNKQGRDLLTGVLDGSITVKKLEA